MALINCPECNRQISDKAEACPHCGYPLQQRATSAADVLAGQRWRVQSQTLGDGRVLDGIFDQSGRFSGTIYAPPGDFFLQSQRVNGKWHIAGSLLIFEWDWVQSSGPYHEQVPIEISELSQDRLKGVDRWLRLWEFERVQS